MAILDTEYVKAPSLRAGDLSIAKSPSGFSMFEGNTVFLTGDANGTLTIGKENLTSSIPVLHINAEEVYWNNKPLEDYWGGESGGIVPDLTQDVTRLQELTAENAQAIQDTDERLSQEISDLRMDALGAEINTLVKPINNYVSNICGVAVPVTLLKDTLPYFNKITLNNVQNSGTGYLAIYACDAETPSVSSTCTLLYVSEEAFETTGAPTAPTSSTISIPEKINVPDSKLIILIFASSSTTPQPDNISWITADNSTMVIRMGIYSPGSANRPYDTNGVYVLQKVTNPAFLTYSPDIDFSYVVYSESEDILAEDIEVMKSQIEDLQADLGNYMTYEETIEAINNFPGPIEGYEYTLDTLVAQLSNVNVELSLTKRSTMPEDNGAYTNVGVGYSGVNVRSGGFVGSSTTIRELARLEMTNYEGFQISHRYAASTSTTELAQLSLQTGRLELGLQQAPNSGGFELVAKTMSYENSSSSTGVYMTYYSPQDMSHKSYLYMNGEDTAVMVKKSSSVYAGMEVRASEIRLLRSTGSADNVWELKFDREGLGLGTYGLNWDALVNEYSSIIPTISVVYAMIRSALANQ